MHKSIQHLLLFVHSSSCDNKSFASSETWLGYLTPRPLDAFSKISHFDLSPMSPKGDFLKQHNHIVVVWVDMIWSGFTRSCDRNRSYPVSISYMTHPAAHQSTAMPCLGFRWINSGAMYCVVPSDLGRAWLGLQVQMMLCELQNSQKVAKPDKLLQNHLKHSETS